MPANQPAQRLSRSRVTPARALPGLADDVRRGLLQRPRELAPKYFYDDHGSVLFEAICATPEYYPSRAEAALLETHAERIIALAAPAQLLELGSGSSRKTRYLLDACTRLGNHCVYWPFDVSAGMLHTAGAELVEAYPWLYVHALTGDYTGGVAEMPLPDSGRRLIVFLGGTLGNFEPDQAHQMLAEIAGLMRAGDTLLLGVDRVKDAARMEAAYDDAEGITAAFNRNVLTVLNRELDADFALDLYRHRAVFNAEAARIEMHLVAERDHRVQLPALDTYIDMQAGETIRTEVSHKFTPASIESLLAGAGLAIRDHYAGQGEDYSLVLAQLAADQFE